MPIAENVMLGRDVQIPQPDLVNLYGCQVGDFTKIGSFVEIQKNAAIGKNCKVSSHSFICEGVTIEDEVFIGHGVMFINDKYPQAANEGKMLEEADWQVVPINVAKGASIGSGCQVMCGVSIGKNALIGAGTVVTRDVPAYAVVAGNPGRITGDVRSHAEKQR